MTPRTYGVWEVTEAVLIAALFCVLITRSCTAEGAEPDWTRIEQVIVGEAASEGYEGMYAVGCVLRNRGWNLHGISAHQRKDLTAFVHRQRARVRADAATVVRALRHGASDSTGGSNHYENVEAFGTPWWAEGHTPTRKIGRHTFWKI